MHLLRVILTLCLVSQAWSGLAPGSDCCSDLSYVAPAQRVGADLLAATLSGNTVGVLPHAPGAPAAADESCDRLVGSDDCNGGDSPGTSSFRAASSSVDELSTTSSSDDETSTASSNDDALSTASSGDDETSIAASGHDALPGDPCSAGCDFCEFCACCMTSLSAHFTDLDGPRRNVTGDLVYADLRSAAIPPQGWDILHVPKRAPSA